MDNLCGQRSVQPDEPGHQRALFTVIQHRYAILALVQGHEIDVFVSGVVRVSTFRSSNELLYDTRISMK